MVDLGPADPRCADLLEIRKAAGRSADLTRQLLAFARKQTVAPKVLDLNETVEGMLKMLRRLIGEDVELAWLPRAGIWPVKIDPSQIDQILANLCVNARDAIAGVGKITIETGTASLDGAYCADHPGFVPGDYVLLAVSDNGCGMDEDALAHLFEPFFTTKALGQGTGLGLATVYGIVKQNNGLISVYSEPSQGTTFRIYLPRHAGGIEKPETAAAAAPAVQGHETILLVEDETAILTLATKMLTRLGYTVLAAGTPGEAIAAGQRAPGLGSSPDDRRRDARDERPGARPEPAVALSAHEVPVHVGIHRQRHSAPRRTRRGSELHPEAVLVSGYRDRGPEDARRRGAADAARGTVTSRRSGSLRRCSTMSGSPPGT